jgi:hypothetical protein
MIIAESPESPPGAAYHNNDDHVPRIQVARWPRRPRPPGRAPPGVRARAPGRTVPASDTGPGPRAAGIVPLNWQPPSRTRRDAGDAASAAGRATVTRTDPGTVRQPESRCQPQAEVELELET